MAATIDMHGDKPENILARGRRNSPGRAPEPTTSARTAPPRASKDGDENHDGYPFEDLTCDLSAEPIAAAMGLQRGSERAAPLDNHPTLESPPPRPVMRGPATAPKVAGPAIKRAAQTTTPPPPLVRPADRPAAVSVMPSIRPIARALAPKAERTSVVQTALLDAPPASEPMPIAAAPAAEPNEVAVPPGQLLHGRYELEVLLGRGGMASVYKAIDHHRANLGLADQIVAVKVVQANASRPASPAALIQEFQSAQRLSHPNVINVFDIDQDGDTTFYSMELLSGARLSQLLRRVDGTVLQRRYALAIIRDIGAAVAHAHARGVVHADLKPSNVMITQEGEVRVLDFGGSSMPPREPWVSAGDTDDAYHHATPAYASCEQLERRRADPRDDIYAIACIAYLLLAGRHPFDYQSSIEARSRAMQARRPSGVPLRQWRALRQGLAWARAAQPASIEPWLAALGLDAAVTKLPPLTELTAAAESPSPWLRPILMGVAAAAVAVGAAAVLSNSDVDWNGTLDSGIRNANNLWQKSWQVVDPNHGAQPIASAPSIITPAVTATPPAAVAKAPIKTPSAVAVAAPRAAEAAIAPPATTPRGSAVISTANGVIVASASANTATAVTETPAHVAFASQSYTVGAADPAARIVIRRMGNSQGELNFIWWTEGDSAQPEVDYASLGARTEHLASGEDRVTVYVPIISNPLRKNTTQFQVVLADASSHRGNGSAPNARATVTIEGNR